MKPQLLIGAASSGSGKTTFTMGLLRALKMRGLVVQPFKCGPDYIDTQFHTLAAGRSSINLDTYMASEAHVRHLYRKYGEEANVCVAEGVMGLFDGYQRMQGSSAEIAGVLGIPIVLVVSARSTAYSVAPLIYGFKHFNPSLRIAGVVFNQVSSLSHYSYLKDACTDAGVECLGYLPASEGLKIPSRHLGLTLSAKQAMEIQIDKAAELINKHVDIERLLQVCNCEFPELPENNSVQKNIGLRIAVGYDEAFNFVYRENLSRLEELGEVTYFSPLSGKAFPEADLIYLPGGYPELFARRLQHRRKMMDALKAYAENGGKILAECGGMMYLTRSLTVSKGGTSYQMAGILPLDATMEGARLHLGYRRVQYKDMELKGHEFHYSDLTEPGALPSVARQFNAKGMEVNTPLYRYKNVIAGYTHLYWGETDILKLWDE